jgi:hypothetical protein
LEHHRIGQIDTPVLFTEGVKKADSITSAARRESTDILAVGISGVWNWLSEGEPISDMYDILAEDRRVYVCFDSDMFRKPEVMMAAERLAEWLATRGAAVWIVCLPNQPDGSKTGADDFLAAGGTLERLLSLARPFDPEDLRREKLSRDQRLRRYLADLRRQHDELPAKTRGECSRRAAWRACLTVAERHGKPVEDGVLIERLSTRTGAELAAMAHMTFARAMGALIEAGRIRRIERKRSEHTDSYVLIADLRAEVLHDGVWDRAVGQGDTKTGDDNETHRGVTVPRAGAPAVPELRWPYVATVRERAERGRLREVHEYVDRLGKPSGEIVRFLLKSGGSSTVAELMAVFAGERTRLRDFKRRRLAALTGAVRRCAGTPLSVGPAVIAVSGDVVRLVDGWDKALECHRTLGREQDAAFQQKAAHLRQRAAYRARNEAPPGRAPTEDEMAEGREERMKRRRVAGLVYQGMARRFAVEGVLGAAGYIEELHPVEDSEPPASPDPSEDLVVHPLECECLDCSAPMPRYARLAAERIRAEVNERWAR